MKKALINQGFFGKWQKGVSKTRQCFLGFRVKNIFETMAKNSILDFKPARLQEGNVWQIVYYATNPLTDKMERVRIKINHIKDLKQRKKYANTLISQLNAKLYDGWNPWNEKSSPKGTVTIQKALQKFIEKKDQQLRNDSMRSYRSYNKSLNEWLISCNKQETICAKFNKSMALDFMDWIFDKKYTNRTYNNYLNFMKGLFNWLVENGYTSENWFAGLEKLKKEQKEREPIPIKTREQIIQYLEAKDYDFLIVCVLVFHALIRPKEITMLKKNDFNLKKQIIHISAESSKNRKQRITTIPNSMMPYLVSWNWNSASEDQYLFGKDFKPGTEPLNPRRFSKKWDAMRKALKLPQKYKLYSLRDSGIIQMLNDGISPEEIMKQADHSSLEITTIYAKHINAEGSEQIKTKSTGFK
jgi:integrase